MISPFEIYLITKLTSFVAFLGSTGGCLCAASIACWIPCHVRWFHEADGKAFAQKFHRKAIIAFVMSLFLILGAVLTPTTKQACLAIVIPKIVNNETVQEIPQKLLDVADEWIDELRPADKSE